MWMPRTNADVTTKGTRSMVMPFCVSKTKQYANDLNEMTTTTTTTKATVNCMDAGSHRCHATKRDRDDEQMEIGSRALTSHNLSIYRIYATSISKLNRTMSPLAALLSCRLYCHVYTYQYVCKDFVFEADGERQQHQQLRAPEKYPSMMAHEIQWNKLNLFSCDS